ncbi:MAG: CHASE3 domain-containing protein [Chloroflexi bacterium]|nr:CHASE3 domain-containing protein [Chloroflexota bacterium]
MGWRRGLSGWPLRRSLGALVLVMLVVFTGAAAVAAFSVRDVMQRIGRTSNNLVRLSSISDRLLAGMLTQETLARTYALSGEAVLKRQLQDARTGFNQTLREAETLPDLDATSRELLRQQKATADRWYIEVGQREIQLKDAGRDDLLTALVRNGAGRRMVEDFRTTNAEFRSYLDQLGRQEASQAQRDARRGGILIVFAIGFAATCGLGGLWYVRRGVLAPVKQIMAAVGAVGAGRLDVRVEPSGAKEFRALGGAFNDTVAAMEAAEEDRRRLEQLKTDFISVVSHELRTPLTSIQGYTEFVLDGDAGEITPEQREYLQIALSNTVRLVDLVNDLLDLSRIESGRFDLERAPVDLGGVVEEALTTMRPILQAKSQQLSVDVAAGLAPVEGDRRRLVQVAINLLSNASKYTPEGGAVTVSVEPGGGSVRLVVRDTGQGMRPEDLAHLFERFFRARSPDARAVTGTGLGLAITKSIVELHGGQIAVQSALGVGSRFEVTFPAMGGDRGRGPGVGEVTSEVGMNQGSPRPTLTPNPHPPTPSWRA